MKVSIIIPVYHVEEYIERCVLSVLKQTYRPLEVVLVDDYSNDKSIEIAKRTIEENFPTSIEFQFIKHEKNLGQSGARNTGIRNSTGDFLYFLDSDDELADDAINNMMEKQKGFPEVEIIQGTMVHALDNGNVDVNHMSFVKDNRSIRKLFFSRNSFLLESACDKLIKKSFILCNNLFFKEGIILEDYHWLNYVVKKVNQIAFVFQPTYIRYLREGSTMTSLTREREIRNIGIILKDFVASIDEPCYDEQLFTYYNKFLTYYGASKGEYGFNELYVTFRNLFFRRKFYKMGILMILYRKRFFYKEANIKARIRGYMYHNINAFFERKDCC